MQRFVKEPLVHFLVLGALLFAGYTALNRHRASALEPARIVISQGQLASMMENFTRTWQRAPTRQEWDALIRDRVREEVYCREARALGLDKDDIVIRRRLRQKMEFISHDIAAQTPADAELNAYLQANPDKFRVEQWFTFRHLYLNPEKRGANLARDAAVALAKLNQTGGDANFARLGDAFALEPTFTNTPGSVLAQQFGSKFAAKLAGLQPGPWQGPVESAFGFHLVYLSERSEGRLPALADVRDAVGREWENARRLGSNEEFFQELLKKYSVTVESSPANAQRPVKTQ